MEEHTIKLYLTHGGWLICLSFALVAVELLTAQLGLLCPGVFILAFYLTVAYNWRLGLLIGCLALIVIEVVLGRSGTLLPVMLLVVGTGKFWKTSGDSSTLFSQIFPGAFLGALYAASAVIAENVVIQPPGLSIALPVLVVHIVKSFIVAAVVLPLVVLVADWIAELLAINLYHRQAPGATRGT